MRKLKVGPDFTIFVLFFGASLFEALWHHDWLMTAAFAALAVLFLRIGHTRAPR